MSLLGLAGGAERVGARRRDRVRQRRAQLGLRSEPPGPRNALWGPRTIRRMKRRPGTTTYCSDWHYRPSSSSCRCSGQRPQIPNRQRARRARRSPPPRSPASSCPPPDPTFGGVIKEKASESTPWWAPRVVPPKGAPNVLLIMTDDAGFGAPGTFGGVIPTPALDRSPRTGLRYTNFHSTSLCSPTRAALITGPQPPCRRLRRRRRDRHRLSPATTSIIRKENGTIGTHPEGQRLRHLLVRQGPQHALLPGDPGRAVRPVADRHGLRVFLRLRRRRREPVAAEPVPQHDGDLPLRGQSRLEPDHGDGRRGDPLHEAAEGDRARQAVLRLLRAGRHPCAAPSDAGVGQEDQRHAPVRRRLEQAARDDLRQPEAARHHAARPPS